MQKKQGFQKKWLSLVLALIFILAGWLLPKELLPDNRTPVQQGGQQGQQQGQQQGGQQGQQQGGQQGQQQDQQQGQQGGQQNQQLGQQQSRQSESTDSYHFSKESYLDEHFKKHKKEFSYKTKEEYLRGANRVINHPDSLCKKEEEDGDDVYYLEETNELVIVSKYGFIRTYFKPTDGIDYYNRT